MGFNDFFEGFAGRAPVEVSSDKRAAATDLFENYCAFKEAGFEDQEAIQIVISMLQMSMRIHAEGGEGE